MTTRIVFGLDEDVPAALRALLDMVPDDQRSIVWVGEENAVDVPDEVAEKFLPAAPKKKAAKAAKAAPPPVPETEEEEV
jgi:hypothetical protein